MFCFHLFSVTHLSLSLPQESLSTALAPLAKHLGPYLTEREQKDLLVRLLRNLASPKGSIRRAAATSALAWAQGCDSVLMLPYLIEVILHMATQQSKFFTPSKLPAEGSSPQRNWIPADNDCEAGALVGLAHIFRTAASVVLAVPFPLAPILQLAITACVPSILIFHSLSLKPRAQVAWQ